MGNYLAGDTRTITELISLLLQYLGAFTSNGNKLPVDADVTVSGGTITAENGFKKDGVSVSVTENTTTYASNIPLPVKIIDRSSTDFLSSFQIADIDDDATPNYYGFERLDGKWYILKEDTSAKTYRYRSGASGYSTAWAGRASGDAYGYLSTLTW